MARVVTATEARVHFGELMRRVVENEETVIVERAGKPQVAVVPVAAYERLTAQSPARPHWQELLEKAHDRIRRDLGDRELPPAEELLREMREERSAHLFEVCRREPGDSAGGES